MDALARMKEAIAKKRKQVEEIAPEVRISFFFWMIWKTYYAFLI